MKQELKDDVYYLDEPDDSFSFEELKNCSKADLFRLYEQTCKDYDLVAKRISESTNDHTVFFVARHQGLSYPLVYSISAEDLGIELRSDPEAFIERVVRKLIDDFEERKPVSTADQAAKSDAGKEQLTLVPRRIIHDICQIRMYGNSKYPEGGVDNWKKVSKERYRDAAYRHFMAYLDDPQGLDEESGMPHYWHLACNVAFICELEDKDLG